MSFDSDSQTLEFDEDQAMLVWRSSSSLAKVLAGHVVVGGRCMVHQVPMLPAVELENASRLQVAPHAFLGVGESLWPVAKRPKKAKDELQGLGKDPDDAPQSSTGPKPKARTGGIKYLPPAASIGGDIVEVGDDSGSEASDPDSLPASPPSELEEIPPPPPPPPVADVVAPAPPPLPRNVRGIPWGDWSLAPISRGGVLCAYGATCRNHSNGPGDATVCKISRTLAHRGRVMSEDEARVRMKLWLLAGRDIDPGQPNQRQLHLDIDPRSLPLRSEAEVDADL